MSKKMKCRFGSPILLAFFLIGGLEKTSASFIGDEEITSKVSALITHYKSTLPIIDDERSSENIVDFLQHLSKKEGPGSLEGREELVEKTKRLMETGEPLSFVLPSFPFKSFNETKVTSPGEIDLAEVLALATLEHLCHEIKKVYEPGAHLIIVPDALRIACFLDVQSQRKEYISSLRGLLPSDCIKVKELQDFEDSPTTGKTLEEIALFLSKRESHDADKEPYMSFVSHELDCPFHRKKEKVRVLEVVRNQRTFKDKFPEERKEEVKELSCDEFIIYLKTAIEEGAEDKENYERLVRSLEGSFNMKLMTRKCALVNAQEAKQLSGYMSELFGDYENHIRLSVNQHHSDISQKLSIQLIQGSPVTPWHNTLFLSSEREMILAPFARFEGGHLKEEIYHGVPLKWISQVG